MLAFLFGAARFLAAILLATFFLARAVVVAPLPASALAPLAALACIDVATVPKTALAAAVEAAFAVAPAVAAALATSPASTLALSAALFPAAKTVSRALVMVPLLFIFDLGRATGGLWIDTLVRLKLPKQIVPVVFNPVFCELVAFKSADDDHGPLRLAARCGKSHSLRCVASQVPRHTPLSPVQKRSFKV